MPLTTKCLKIIMGTQFGDISFQLPVIFHFSPELGFGCCLICSKCESTWNKSWVHQTPVQVHQLQSVQFQVLFHIATRILQACLSLRVSSGTSVWLWLWILKSCTAIKMDGAQKITLSTYWTVTHHSEMQRCHIQLHCITVALIRNELRWGRIFHSRQSNTSCYAPAGPK